MADHAWPTGLPCPLLGTLKHAPAFSNILRSQFDGGEKVRLRKSWVPEVMTCSLHLSRAQLQILHDFYWITLRQLRPFTWVEFRDPARGPCTYAFREIPQSEEVLAGRRWRVQLTLDVLTPFNGTFPLGDGSGGVLTTDDDETLTT